LQLRHGRPCTLIILQRLVWHAGMRGNDFNKRPRY
jgi:hypothetical protein